MKRLACSWIVSLLMTFGSGCGDVEEGDSADDDTDDDNDDDDHDDETSDGETTDDGATTGGDETDTGDTDGTSTDDGTGTGDSDSTGTDGTDGTDGTGDTDTDDGDETGTDDTDGTGTDDSDETGTDDSDETGTGDSDETGTGDGDETGTDDGDETGTDDGDETGTGDGTGTDDGTGTGDDGTGTECTADNECGGPTPYCEAGTCVDCTGLVSETCADKNAATPACRPDDGVCVECHEDDADLCVDDTPVCGDNDQCRACDEHSECSVACNLDEGSCMPDDQVFYVDRDLCTMGDEDGTVANPYCAIGSAVDAIASSGEGTIFVTGGGGTYAETVTIDGGKTVAILGTGGPAIALGAENAVEVTSGTRVYLANVALGETLASTGVDCTSGIVWVDDSTIEDNANNGIASDTCEVHVRRTMIRNSGGHGIDALDGSYFLEDVQLLENNGVGLGLAGTNATATVALISGNALGGISIDGGADLTLVTSMVGNNGDDGDDTRAIDAVDGVFALLYVTVAGNHGNGAGKSIACDPDGGGTVRNSIVVAEEVSSVACAGLAVSDSAVQDGDITSGNTDVGAWNATWFTDVAIGDLHLGSGQADFADIAQWMTADPTADIDGDARPITNGAADWPGADVP